jgi:SagB-type dehydrogenase family enzyme
MKKIPHDYYLKFIDPVVFDEVSAFHSKTNFVIHESVSHMTRLHRLPEDVLINLTGNELALYPDMVSKDTAPIDRLEKSNPFYRNPSCNFFSKSSMALAQLKELVAPLLSKKTDSHHRGYPSGGALYPIEVFCCNLSMANWQNAENVLHIMPQSSCFEAVKGNIDTALLRKSLLPAGSTIGTPSVALIYISYMPKTLFKYRYRGYRLAHLEAGSMYMLLDLHCKALKLQSRVWSAYCDNMLCKSLGLNPTLFFPLCVQFFGE